MKLQEYLNLPEKEQDKLSDEEIENIESDIMILPLSRSIRNKVRITVYHATDIPSTKREYGFTIGDTPRDTVEAKVIEVSKEEFQRLLKANMEEVSKFVRDVLR